MAIDKNKTKELVKQIEKLFEEIVFYSKVLY